MPRLVEVLGNNVIVKQRVMEGMKEANGELVTDSGIFVKKDPKGGTFERFEGHVVAVGCEVKQLKKGHLVSFGKHSFSIKSWHKKEFLIIDAGFLIAVETDVGPDHEPDESQFIVKE